MANTELITTQTVGGNQNFGPFAIEYIDITDIKVSLDGVLQTLTTEYTIDSATSTVTFVTAPDVGAVIRIFRETPVENAKAILYPGSSIRAQNVNDNTEQALFAIQEIKDQYVTESGGEFVTNVDLNDNRITNLADPTDAQDAATKAYVDDNTWDDETETIHSDEAWTSVDSQIATTASIENRIEAKIDAAITGDIGTDGTGITVTNDGDGTITLGIASNSVDLDRLKNSDIITQAEQDAGSPSPADTNIFTAAAAARRFDGIVQLTTPTGSDWETGKIWYQNDEEKTVSIWDGDSWDAITSGGTFARLDKVVYVDSINGDDDLNGHRISTPKRTIRAAINQINAESDADGNGSVVVVAPGIYAEEFPIDIEKNDVSIVGQSLRNCIIHPAIPAADQAGYDVDVPEANELTTMFRVNSGTYIANLTLMGMKASGARGANALDTDATYGLPEFQGWNFAFFPGATIRKSPYIQNCTNFSDSQINNVNFTPHTPGEGAAGDLDSAPSGGGILVDGSAVDAASPLRSMVCDSYTHTALDGPGIFVTNNGYCQATSSYSFFNHYHLKCLNGGQANLAASTTDFGRYSLIADGRSPSAIFTAQVNGAALAGATTFNVDNLVDDWFGSATRPQDNMLVQIGSDVYPILSATAVAGGWTVEISRPNPNDRTENLGLINDIANDAAVNFYLRSMIASSGHTMEYVGSGTNYQALPSNGGVPDENNHIIELNNAKVWAAITDHQGTFKVGETFTVNQQTGFVSIPAGALSVNTLLEDLDVNGNEIVSNSNGDIVLNPHGTGGISLQAETDLNSNKIVNVTDPTANQDAATKKYVDDSVGTLNLISADIERLADIEDGTLATDAIQTVAGIADDVVTVAGISSEVTTLAGIETELLEIEANLDSITYLGAQTSDPSFDTLGNPIDAGDFYFNTTLSQARIYNGITFQSFAENGLVNQSFANETFSAVYTAAAGSNTIDLGDLTVPSGAFGDENATAVRMSLAAGADTFDLGSL